MAGTPPPPNTRGQTNKRKGPESGLLFGAFVETASVETPDEPARAQK